MSKISPRPLHKDVLPAVASFAITLAAGVAISFFQLTGGFPDKHQDRPAFVDDETYGVDAAGADTPLVAEVDEPPTGAAVVEQASAQTEVDSSRAYDADLEADLSAPHQFMVDTESIDSILSTDTLAGQPARVDATRPKAGSTAALSSEIAIDILPLP